jgi:hypothetical protein
MCTLGGLTAQGWVQDWGEWSLERQEQLMIVAGLRPLTPLADNSPGDYPVNVECVQCGGAQTDSLFGFSEGVRLSWLPCLFCNAARFKPTEDVIRARFETLGLKLRSPWAGDPGAGLEARCLRCGSDRIVSWSALSVGTPPCIRCDGRRLDPDAPHRVYLFLFPHLGAHGVYKVGITHCVDDQRLTQHKRVNGNTVQLDADLVLGRVLGARPAGVMGALDVPLGHLALDDAWRCAAAAGGVDSSQETPEELQPAGAVAAVLVRGEKRPVGRRFAW